MSGRIYSYEPHPNWRPSPLGKSCKCVRTVTDKEPDNNLNVLLMLVALRSDKRGTNWDTAGELCPYCLRTFNLCAHRNTVRPQVTPFFHTTGIAFGFMNRKIPLPLYSLT